MNDSDTNFVFRTFIAMGVLWCVLGLTRSLLTKLFPKNNNSPALLCAFHCISNVGLNDDSMSYFG